MKIVINKLRLLVSAELPAKSQISSSFRDRILSRARSHLEDLKNQKHITDYWLCSDLQGLFDAARRFGARRVIVGIGYPDLHDLTIEKRTWLEAFRGQIAKVEIPPRSRFSDHRLGLALTAAIAHRLGVNWQDIDETSVEAAIWASKRANTAAKVPLYKLVPKDELAGVDTVAESRSVALVAKKERHGFEFNVNVLYPLDSDDGLNEIAIANALRKTLLTVTELARSEIQMLIKIFLSEIASNAASALRRADLPLFRFSLPVEVSSSKGANYIGSSLTQRAVVVSIVTDDDKMNCYIVGKPRLQRANEGRKRQRDSVPEISFDEFKAAVLAQGIHIADAGGLAEVYRKVTAQDAAQNIELLIAQGVRPIHPEEPIIKRGVVAQKTGSFPRLFAAPGDVVAEIVYQKPGSDGVDVFGNAVKFNPADLSQFLAGAGVKLRGQTFIATESGAVKIEGNTVVLTESVSVEGSLFAREGVFRTQSALSIGGNIEKGAAVICKGTLQVGQSFFGELIKAGADVTIAGGINGTDKSEVIVKGDLRVKYIQSGLIRCKGSVTIEANMTGGTVIADGDVTVIDPQGGIFGGTVIAGGKISVGNLGRQGKGTFDVRMGLPVKGIRRKMILEKREAALIAERDRLSRYGTKKQTINEKLDRLSTLTNLIRERIESIVIRSTADSKVAVTGVLQSGVRFQIGSERLIVADAVSGCVVSAKDGRIVIRTDSAGDSAKADDKPKPH